MKLLVPLIILLLSSTGTVSAEIFTARPYLSELRKIERTKTPRTMEKLYVKGQELCDELTESMGTLSEDELARSTAALKGITIIFTEPSGARINPEFMLHLAKSKGKPPDIAFFEILSHEKPAGSWDIYTKSLEDFNYCSVLGTGVFVKFYGLWAGYAKKYPKNYTETIKDFMQGIEDSIVRSSCICGSREDAAAELKAFRKAYPRTHAKEDISDRLLQINRKSAEIKFECSGQ